MTVTTTATATARKKAVSTERLLWTAGVVVGASLPHWLTLSAWVPALLSFCVIWRLTAAVRGWPLPGAVMRIVLAFIAFIAVLAQYRTINGVEAGSALLVVMVALKFLESHNHRDQLVLMIISYFLVFASLLYERSLLTVLYLLGFVWFTTVGLLQLARKGPLLHTVPTIKLAARLLLQALPIMLVLFLLFPRLPGPLWGIPGTNTSGQQRPVGHHEPRRHYRPRAFRRGGVPGGVRRAPAPRSPALLARPRPE